MSQTKKEITIQGLKVEVLQPYVAGHVITEAEAKALNQTRSEAIRNNKAPAVKKAYEGLDEGAEPSAEVMKELLAEIAKYDEEYEFTLASVGGGRASRDPIDVEAARIARQAITAQLKAKGVKVSDVDKDKLAAKIAAVADSPEVRKQAAKAVKDRQALAEGSLADLDL